MGGLFPIGPSMDEISSAIDATATPVAMSPFDLTGAEAAAWKPGNSALRPLSDKPENPALRAVAGQPRRSPRDLPPIPDDPPYSSYIGNMNYKTTIGELKAFLEKELGVQPEEGVVKEVRFIERDGQFQGYGFAEFIDRDALQHIVNAGRSGSLVLEGRILRVDIAKQKSDSDAPRARSGSDVGAMERTMRNKQLNQLMRGHQRTNSSSVAETESRSRSASLIQEIDNSGGDELDESWRAPRRR